MPFSCPADKEVAVAIGNSASNFSPGLHTKDFTVAGLKSTDEIELN